MTKITTSILEVTPESYKHFSCGKIELDEYLRRYAKGNHKKGISKTFVLKDSKVILGFYTISMSSIEFSSFSESKQKGLPKYPIPVAKIGRLAVDSTAKGKGIGKFLLVDALHRIYEASKIVAAFAVIVDAKDSESKKFYQHFGFIECKENELTLFLPLETIQTLLS